MAIVLENNYVGDGVTVLYSFTFEYIEPTDVEVSFDSVPVTTWSLANATTVQLDAAPTAGTAIRIYRRTKVEEPKATFYPGSAIRSQDLNDNFEQILFVTQESDSISTRAEVAAAAAEIAANDAETAADTAVAAGNTALQIATDSAVVSGAAQQAATAAVADAAAALSAASTAETNSANAVADASTALSASNTAVSTANSAASDATAATSTANTAASDASSAVTTANNALSTANTADTNATTALNTANTADSNAANAVAVANNAAAAVGDALLFDVVPNVASIPASPADGDAVEVTDATGIESFTPLVGLPAGLVGDVGLTVDIRYTTAGATWNYLKYYPNDPDSRYAGPNTDAGTASLPAIAFAGDRNTGIYSPGADQVALATNGTGRLFVNASGKVGIGTTDPGAELHVRGSGPASYIRVNGATGGGAYNHIYGDTNGVIAISADPGNVGANSNIKFQIDGTDKLRITSAGLVGIGTSTPGTVLHCSATDAVLTLQGTRGTGASATIGTSGSNSQDLLITAGTDLYYRGETQHFQSVDGLDEYGSWDSSGRLLVGTSASPTGGDAQYSNLVVKGYAGDNTGYAPIALMAGTNGASLASDAGIGRVEFCAADSASFAQITASVDGTTNSNNYPGRLTFSTTASGASTPAERLRINNIGALGLSGANYGSSGQVLTSSGSGSAPIWTTPVVPPNASTAVKGIVQLSTSTSSTSTSLAATASAAKAAYDRGSTGVSNAATAQSTANTANTNANTALGRTNYGIVKGWVNYDGTNGGVRESDGVSSVSRLGTGVCRINWSYSFGTTTYACVAMTSFGYGDGYGIARASHTASATSFQITTFSQGVGDRDNGWVMAIAVT